MITAEYLRKHDLFTQYKTNQLSNLTVASTSWPASSSEGMVDYSIRIILINWFEGIVKDVSERVSLVNR